MYLFAILIGISMVFGDTYNFIEEIGSDWKNVLNTEAKACLQHSTKRDCRMEKGANCKWINNPKSKIAREAGSQCVGRAYANCKRADINACCTPSCTTTSAPVTTAAPVTTSTVTAAPGDCSAGYAKKWAKCGGDAGGWNGPTCCKNAPSDVTGQPISWYCYYQDAWYSQCKPCDDGSNDAANAPECQAMLNATPPPMGAHCNGEHQVAWGQCGGKGYTGTTCCVFGYECIKDNEWWSSCKPCKDVNNCDNEGRASTMSTTQGGGATTQGGVNCKAGWEQCGGNGYTGATCCVAGYSCVRDNEWWSACKPNANNIMAVDTNTIMTNDMIGTLDYMKVGIISIIVLSLLAAFCVCSKKRKQLDVKHAPVYDYLSV